MRVNAVDSQESLSEQRIAHDDQSARSELTPARRAALDALEREFHELLQAREH